MKWIRERDALIAQTLAFVQSVTGRKEDFRQPDTAVVAPAASVEVASSVAIERTVEIGEPSRPEPPPLPSVPPLPSRASSEPAPEPMSQSQPTSYVAPPRATSEFRSEVQARVANFRKHQERFEREREEYCAATLARARATAAEPAPRPLSGK